MLPPGQPLREHPLHVRPVTGSGSNRCNRRPQRAPALAARTRSRLAKREMLAEVIGRRLAEAATPAA